MNRSQMTYSCVRQYAAIWNTSKSTIISSVRGQVKTQIEQIQSFSSVNYQNIPQHIERSRWRDEAILYVHWPYCKKKCTYCDFNKYVVDDIDHRRMRDCLIMETSELIRLSGVKKIKSVFFGGGTPSLAKPSTIASVLDTVRSSVEFTPGTEVTLEANPTSAESNKLREFRDAGVNRISLGIQSLNDGDLRVLGREHSAAEAIHCIEICRKLFPGRTSVDVIFGRPGQDVEQCEQELNQVLDLCDDHLSVFQLTLEKGTVLFQQVMDRDLALPSQDVIEDMYGVIVKNTAERGFSRYEASNFAKNPGAESVHNKGYWQSSQYLGVGPGAHGRFIPVTGNVREARLQAPVPDQWMSLVEKHGHGTIKVTQQPQLDILQEVLMQGMRAAQGISNKQWEIFTETSLQDVFGEAQVMKMLQDEGYILFNEKRIQATEKGLNVADGLTRELINILNVVHS